MTSTKPVTTCHVWNSSCKLLRHETINTRFTIYEYMYGACLQLKVCQEWMCMYMWPSTFFLDQNFSLDHESGIQSSTPQRSWHKMGKLFTCSFDLQ